MYSETYDSTSFQFTFSNFLHIMINTMAYCDCCRTSIHLDDISYLSDCEMLPGKKTVYSLNKYCIPTWNYCDNFKALTLKYLNFIQIF